MSTKQIPQHASVIVIGGGIMGCSTLYHLAVGVNDRLLSYEMILTTSTICS